MGKSRQPVATGHERIVRTKVTALDFARRSHAIEMSLIKPNIFRWMVSICGVCVKPLLPRATMPDVFTKAKRSFVMSRIRSRVNKITG
jgi:hypothetical protein